MPAPLTTHQLVQVFVYFTQHRQLEELCRTTGLKWETLRAMREGRRLYHTRTTRQKVLAALEEMYRGV